MQLFTYLLRHLNFELYKKYILTRFMDSKLIGDPLANRRGKLDCITSFFSLPLLLLEAITGASLEDSGLIWVWHFCPVQLWSSCLEAKCVSSHRSEAWWTALKEVKLGIVRYSPMVTFQWPRFRNKSFFFFGFFLMSATNSDQPLKSLSN